MDQCYINLAIVRGDTKQPSFSLYRPTSNQYSAPSNHILLPDLFQWKSKNQSGHNRVLVRGQAGIGKSTLCKRIIYDYIYHGMWADIIDRIIWLPLRHLKDESKQRYDIRMLLFDRYFQFQQDGQLLFDALFKAFQGEQSRTLFILDGLDEVLLQLSSENSYLLKLLLQQPRIIVTTRPYATSLGHITNFVVIDTKSYQTYVANIGIPRYNDKY
ncbi:hypothetical protein F4810DRAFT_374107 [Camillea tinctor]|nr:hypothetical protein F4810DRAFT_374107 [Camillea tinctor]